MNSIKLYFVYLIFALIPPTRLFAAKAAMLRWCGARIGRNVRVVSSARFYLSGNLSIGDDTWIGHEVLVIGGDADVTLGAGCDVAPRVVIATGSHQAFTLSHKAAGAGRSEPVEIHDGAWIGASTTILGGVTVGAVSLVAAGSLVREDVPAGAVVAGVPARVVRINAPGTSG